MPRNTDGANSGRFGTRVTPTRRSSRRYLFDSKNARLWWLFQSSNSREFHWTSPHGWLSLPRPNHNPETTVRTIMPCAGSRHVATHDAGSGAGTGSSLRLASHPQAMAPFSLSQFPKREGSSWKLDPDLTPTMSTAARARQGNRSAARSPPGARQALYWLGLLFDKSLPRQCKGAGTWPILTLDCHRNRGQG